MVFSKTPINKNHATLNFISGSHDYLAIVLQLTNSGLIHMYIIMHSDVASYTHNILIKLMCP